MAEDMDTEEEGDGVMEITCNMDAGMKVASKIMDSMEGKAPLTAETGAGGTQEQEE